MLPAPPSIHISGLEEEEDSSFAFWQQFRLHGEKIHYRSSFLHFNEQVRHRASRGPAMAIAAPPARFGNWRTVEMAEAPPQTAMSAEDLQGACFCGVRLRQGIELFSFLEVFFAFVLLLQTPDLLTVDGRYFYFEHNFDGFGPHVFALHIFMLSSCVASSVLVVAGVRLSRPFLLLPHLLWQAAFVALAAALSTLFAVMTLRQQMLVPSTIVLTTMLLLPATLELWWAYLLWCFYLILQHRRTVSISAGREGDKLFMHTPRGSLCGGDARFYESRGSCSSIGSPERAHLNTPNAPGSPPSRESLPTSPLCGHYLQVSQM